MITRSNLLWLPLDTEELAMEVEVEGSPSQSKKMLGKLHFARKADIQGASP